MFVRRRRRNVLEGESDRVLALALSQQFFHRLGLRENEGNEVISGVFHCRYFFQFWLEFRFFSARPSACPPCFRHHASFFRFLIYDWILTGQAAGRSYLVELLKLL